MPRSRNIKPGFFANDELADGNTPLGRLLFIGLWTLADHKGDLEYRPKRIKAQLLPYDDCDIEEIVTNLEQSGFVTSYYVTGNVYLHINNFDRHQNPHPNERKAGSEIPSISQQDVDSKGLVTSHDKDVTNRADLLIPDSLLLIPDSLNKPPVRTASRFDEWWDAYDLKKNRKKALEIWKRRKLDEKADELIADAMKRHEHDADWKRGFQPHPTTYLNGDRWNDELTQTRQAASNSSVSEREERNRAALNG